MSELYDHYLENGGPPLPDGYSFKVWADDSQEWCFGFTIVGPPTGWRKKRKPEYVSDDYEGDYEGDYVYGRAMCFDVSDEDRRNGKPPPVNWFARCIFVVYASWRAVTYEDEMRERWNAYVGTHP